MDILTFIKQIIKGIISGLLNSYTLTIILFLVAISIIPLIAEMITYYISSYRKLTSNGFFSVKFDKGKYGEYLIYKKLKKFERHGVKFLFNIYIPKENGQTTEIDVIMICSRGIFVFESKNYSGWIFGNENQKNWYQTLPKGKGNNRKESFYNPILQNKSHIKHLQKLIPDNINIWSQIVFSERCTLKNIQINDDAIKVIRRCDVADTVENICKNAPGNKVDDKTIEKLYNTLFPFTQVTDEVKQKHIENIKIIETENKNFENHTEDDADNNINICPKCGASLILRTSSKGNNIGNKFLGCSNYPHCKYISNITDNTESK